MSRPHEPGSSVTHFVGALFGVAALVVMVLLSSRLDAWRVVGASIFGAALVLLYLTSAVYHFVLQNTRSKEVWRRLDHSMIYVLIAGTYTPITLVSLRGGWGWSIFGVVWGLAVLGVLTKAVGVRIPKLISTSMYVLMGWVIIVAIIPLVQVFTLAALFWLFLGGILYTAGTVFYALDHRTRHRRWLGWHEAWHLMVLAGSIAHFWFVLEYVLL